MQVEMSINDDRPSSIIQPFSKLFKVIEKHWYGRLHRAVDSKHCEMHCAIWCSNEQYSTELVDVNYSSILCTMPRPPPLFCCLPVPENEYPGGIIWFIVATPSSCNHGSVNINTSAAVSVI